MKGVGRSCPLRNTRTTPRFSATNIVPSAAKSIATGTSRPDDHRLDDEAGGRGGRGGRRSKEGHEGTDGGDQGCAGATGAAGRAESDPILLCRSTSHVSLRASVPRMAPAV